MFNVVAIAVVLLLPNVVVAGDREYRPGGVRFAKVWDRFYKGDHEPELDDPLIAAGREMTQAISHAICHKDMKFRRYAIGALGFIGDKRAVPTLEIILKDSKEEDYFRGDALHAIYQVDGKLGTKYAKQYMVSNDYLTRIASAIIKKEKWLRQPTKE